MIWVRRVIALPLALVFIFLFAALLIIGRVNGTVGNPDFYAEQLSRADVYNFVYDEALPAALAEVKMDTGNAGSPIDIAALEPHVIDFFRLTLPPEWLEARAEAAIGEMVPYAVGDTAHFTLNLPLKDRVTAGAQAASNILHREEVFGSVYDGIIEKALAEGDLEGSGLPETLGMSEAELKELVITVIPEDWLLGQIDGALDEVTPYFTGEEEHFLVAVDVSSRLAPLEALAADVLAREQTYDYIIEKLVAPSVMENAAGLSLTDDDITDLLKETLPLEWYRARVDEISGQLFAYLRGDQDTVNIVIPVDDRYPVAAEAFGGLIERRLADSWDTLPACSATETLELISDPLGNFPPQCRPMGMTFSQLQGAIDITATVLPLLDVFLPKEFVITDADLRQMLSGDTGQDLLAQGRDIIRDGYTYSDADLRADLGEEYQSLQELREIIAGGLVFSDEDLRQAVADAGSEAEWQEYQAVRTSIGLGRSLFWLAWLVPVLLLAGIGFLCGRNWRSRAIWAAAVLALAAACTYIIFGPVYSVAANPVISEAFISASPGLDGIEGVMVAKGIEIAENSIASFIGGINIRALVVLGVAVIAILLAALWPRFAGGRDY